MPTVRPRPHVRIQTPRRYPMPPPRRLTYRHHPDGSIDSDSIKSDEHEHREWMRRHGLDDLPLVRTRDRTVSEADVQPVKPRALIGVAFIALGALLWLITWIIRGVPARGF